MSLALEADSRDIADIRRAECCCESFEDGVVAFGVTVGQVALPGVGPSSVERAHGVCCRAGDEQACALVQRQQIIIVFQKHHCFDGTFKSGFAEFL